MLCYQQYYMLILKITYIYDISESEVKMSILFPIVDMDALSCATRGSLLHP